MLPSTLIFIMLLATGAILRERSRRIDSGLQHHYLQSIIFSSAEGERYLDQLSLLSNRRAKRVACEMIAALTPIIYKLDEAQLSRISQGLHLPQFLLANASNHKKSKRVRAIWLLSQIPCSTLTKSQIEPFTKDSSRLVRFFAMISMINIDQKNILHYVASFPSPLTPFELSQLLTLLRRGSIAVAYQPLLSSSSHNLNMLGLAVVREFGIESAEEELREIVERGVVDSLRREALYTLASLQLPLCTVTIGGYVRRMARIERQRFLRYATSEGYSQGVLDFFTSKGERDYFHSLIDSYKVKIGCY